MIREAARPLNNNHGTTQRSRLTGALMPDHINVDERSLSDLIAYAASYAKKIKYYNTDGLYEDPESGELLDWTPFFEKSETVFLASLMSSDIHQNDEAIQAAFHQVHQLNDLDRQRENFASLVEALLSLSETLFNWYKKALSFGDSGPLSYIVREVDRAMLGELGIQLRSFGTILKYLEELKGSEKFAQANEDSWHDRLKPLLRYWHVQEATTLLNLSDQAGSALSEQLKFAGARLQEYHRRLYYTLSFIEEMIPDLFNRSVHEKGDHDPDIGLLIAFLRLFSHAQAELNSLSGRHLKYYNEEVLGRKPNGAIPDKTVICFHPNPVIDGVWLDAGTRLLAGVDAEGQPAHYQTDEELYVSQAKVAALKTMFISNNALVKTNSSYQLVTAIYAAPISNSADGQGLEFTGDDLSWPILGEDQFDLGTADRQMGTSVLGFAIASPILLMREGERKVIVRMQFTEDSFATLTTLLEDIAENSEGDSSIGDVFNSVFHRPFRLSITVAEGWLPIEKYRILPLENNPGEPPSLSFEFILPTSTESIANCDPAIHGTDYHTSWPVLKSLLSDEESLYSYSFLRDLELEEIGIDVQVEGLRNVAVYNDIGLLDASRPFVPFGPLPSRNSYLLLGHPELFNRELTSLDIDIDWGDLPEEPGGFAEHYAGYGKDITDDSFKFRLSALTDYKFQPVRTEEREVFNMFTTQLAAEAPLQSRTCLQLGVDSLKRLRLQPYYPLDELEEFTNTSRSGYLKFEFSEPQMAFGHTLYPRIFARQMAQNARPRPFSLLREEDAPLELPNEPYTPIINRLNVNYQAKTVIDLRRLALKKRNQQADERLFRLHPFGTELVFGDGNLKSPFLLPRFDDEGYLMIGLRDFSPPSPISLFFDIAETKKKFNRSPLDINWSYLHHDEWRPFTADQVLSDSTVKLSTRGIVKLLCPAGMTKGTGLMDSSLYWIRVSATGNLNITGRCKEVIPQAVQVSWVNNGDPEHLARPAEDRPPVSGLASPIPGIIGIQQPIPFFGGQPEECEEDFYVRGSERLRHKNRTVNLWDYERLILERFPEIQQVKCIGQHGYEDQLSFGEVLVIVVPVINEVDHRPKVGYRVLAEVEDYLKSLSTPFAKFRVINPVYEQLRINCKIKLRPESVHKQGIVWQEIHDAITAFVCPWLRDGNLQLGGSISKTEVFAIINENPHVAFATAFSIVQVFEQEEDNLMLKDTAVPDAQSELLIPSKTWSVLVPVREHEIIFLDQDEYQSDEITAIDRMRLGADFIVTNTDDDASSTSSNTHKAPKEKFLKASSKWLLG